MGSEQSSLANSNSPPVYAGKGLSDGQGGRKSTNTEATAMMSTTSLISGDFEPSSTFEVTRAFVMEDDITEETSNFDDSSDESDDEEDEQGE